jgi:hypothetical protein
MVVLPRISRLETESNAPERSNQAYAIIPPFLPQPSFLAEQNLLTLNCPCSAHLPHPITPSPNLETYLVPCQVHLFPLNSLLLGRYLRLLELFPKRKLVDASLPQA